MAIKPVTRKEAILNGEKIKPVTRLEYFMEKAVQEGGGGSDETELLTAELGEGTKSGSIYTYKTKLDGDPDLPDENVYLKIDGEEYPLTIDEPYDDIIWAAHFNADNHGEPVDPTKPMHIVQIEEGESNEVQPGLLGATTTYALGVYSDLSTLSNKTITLVQKAAQPSGDNEFVVTADLDIYDQRLSNLSATVEEIGEANAANRPVRLHAVNESGIVMEAYLGLYMSSPSTAMFSGCILYGQDFALTSIVVNEDGASMEIVEFGGGGEEFAQIEGTVAFSSSSATVTITNPADEVNAAAASGKPVCLRLVQMDGQTEIPHLIWCDVAGSANGMAVLNGRSVVDISGGFIKILSVSVVVENNAVTQTAELTSAAILPAYDTTTDSGKVLTIGSSGPEWATP